MRGTLCKLCTYNPKAKIPRWWGIFAKSELSALLCSLLLCNLLLCCLLYCLLCSLLFCCHIVVGVRRCGDASREHICKLLSTITFDRSSQRIVTILSVIGSFAYENVFHTLCTDLYLLSRTSKTNTILFCNKTVDNFFVKNF